MPIAKVLAGIGHFQEHFEENREQYERLAVMGQHPEVFFVTQGSSAKLPGASPSHAGSAGLLAKFPVFEYAMNPPSVLEDP